MSDHRPMTEGELEIWATPLKDGGGKIFQRAANQILDLLSDNAKLQTKLEISRSAQVDLTRQIHDEKRMRELSLSSAKCREDRVDFLKADNAKLQEAIDKYRQSRKQNGGRAKNGE
ncbi:MAG: hypothetical protein IID41_07390 [Planctomycetes bacterium]|nr:hypothetical protein [Planctomycetota bacterium]